jgi:glycerol dehydrogenase
MSVINFPGLYENIPGALSCAGEQIAVMGRSVLVIAGERALESVRDEFFRALEKSGVNYAVEIFSGYPTLGKAEGYAKLAAQLSADSIVGVGGGRVLDAAKLAAEKIGMPCVTVPTIAATCAAWTPLTVLYTADGAQDEYVFLKKSPALIVADMEILKKTPQRYLHSGIADSFAKWHEQASNLVGNEKDFELRTKMSASALALEFLDDYVAEYRKNGAVMGEALENAIDSIFMLIGLVGGIEGKVPNGGLAHPFYAQFTKIPRKVKSLHGEIVAFGLSAQFFIEKRDESFIANFAGKMANLGVPVTLSGLGLEGDIEKSVKTIAQGIHESVPSYGAACDWSPPAIEAAVWRTDEIGNALEGTCPAVRRKSKNRPLTVPSRI